MSSELSKRDSSGGCARASTSHDSGDGPGAVTNSVGGPFQDPLFKKLAVINGMVNKLNKDQMKEKLAQLNLDTRGQKDVLKKRLKSYYKRKALSRAPGVQKKRQRYDYYMVIDFEATCDTNSQNYPHEIIEFPVVLLNAVDGSKVDEFHSYVKPTNNSQLSEFCRNLTKITQAQVDAAPPFPVVLSRMEEWMDGHRLGKGKKFAVVTDGPWDMSRFMYMQCLSSGVAFPRWAERWVNVRKVFCNAYRTPKANVLSMLENLGLAFEGVQHSGIDDARNIARVVSHLVADGCNVYVNESLFHDKMAAAAANGAASTTTPDVVVVAQDEDVRSSDEAENVDDAVKTVESHGQQKAGLSSIVVSNGGAGHEESGAGEGDESKVRFAATGEGNALSCGKAKTRDVDNVEKVGAGSNAAGCAQLLENLSLKSPHSSS